MNATTQFKFTTYLIADVSTRYITLKDGRLIVSSAAPFRLAETDSKEGSIFWVPSDEDLAMISEELLTFGFSEAFVNIFKQLAQQKIPYVRFDANGGEIDGDLPEFDW